MLIRVMDILWSTVYYWSKFLKKKKQSLPIPSPICACVFLTKSYKISTTASSFLSVFIIHKEQRAYRLPFWRFYKRLFFGHTWALRKTYVSYPQCICMVCLMDDVWRDTCKWNMHDQRVVTLSTSEAQNAGLTLNNAKCEFSITHIKFLWQTINSQGIQCDI